MWESFLAYAAEQTKQNPPPGITVALAHKGQIVHDWAAGYSNVETRLPATPRSRFGIGSISESFTALAIMQLAEAGKLWVTDPARRYLPDLAFPGADNITLHHLLTHTAGLPPLGTEPYYAAGHSQATQSTLPPLGPHGRTRIDTSAELIEVLNEFGFTPIAPPGAVMSYSNDGYSLLGAVIENVSGRPYIDYVRDQITEPLGLTETVFGPFCEVGAGARRYMPKRGDEAPGWEPVPDSMTGMAAAPSGGGPQLSNTHDLVRWLELFRRGGHLDGVRLLSPAGIGQMLATHALIAPGVHCGYGLIINQRTAGVTLIGHSGGDAGVAAHVVLALEHGYAAASQSNLSAMAPVRLAEGAVRAACGLPYSEQEPAGFDSVPDAPERFMGTFGVKAVGVQIRVFEDRGGLRYETGGQTYEAVPLGRNALLVRFGPEQWSVATAVVDPSGRTIGIRSAMRVHARE